MHQRFDKQDEKNINNTEMHPANQKAREFSRYLHHLQNFRSHYISLNDWTRPPAHKCINFGSKGSRNIEFGLEFGFELGTGHYLSPEGVGGRGTSSRFWG